jgi:hypothetical protein
MYTVYLIYIVKTKPCELWHCTYLGVRKGKSGVSCIGDAAGRLMNIK